MLNRFFVKLSRVYHRNLVKYSDNPRPASYPYVTGDGFRQLADHIYDEAKTDFNPDVVKPGQIIFLGNSRIKNFFKEFNGKIKADYVLISHNGDENVDQEAVGLMDERVKRWYGINVVVKHPKVVPIPLGIENLHYYVLGIPSNFRAVKKMNLPKKNRIFYGFTVASNPGQRQPALDVLSKYPLAETLKGSWLTFRPYLKLLAGYKFTASPEGSSIEGHRNWDALYMGVSPIVTRSVTTEYFQSLGIPMWLVDDWRELNSLTEADLDKKYQELWKGFDESKLYMDYWVNKIKTLA